MVMIVGADGERTEAACRASEEAKATSMGTTDEEACLTAVAAVARRGIKSKDAAASVNDAIRVAAVLVLLLRFVCCSFREDSWCKNSLLTVYKGMFRFPGY